MVAVGNLPAGTDVEATAPFRLHVHPDADRGGLEVVCNNPGPGGACSNFVPVSGGCVSDTQCRRTVLEDYRVEIAVAISADEPGAQTSARTIPLDLDLNSHHPSVPTTSFTEGFEAGFGNFQFLNIDDNKASNSASDGYRCQYVDPSPYCPFAGPCDQPCYLGFAGGQTPVNDWHVHSVAAPAPDGGRAYLGDRSMHYGKHSPGNPGLDTYGLSQLDAIRTRNSAPIHLAARVCQTLQDGQVQSTTSR